MDPLSILGLIGTVVGLGTTIKHLYCRVETYISNSKSVPEFFETLLSNLRLIVETLDSPTARPKNAKPPDSRLSPRDGVVQRLEFLLQRLDHGLSAVTPIDGDSKTILLWKAFKSTRFEDEAARLWQQILGCCQSLNLNRTLAGNASGNQRQVEWMPPITDIPHNLQVPFVGREEILSKITNVLSTWNGTSTPTVVLHGMGGQGKTQLALQYCIQNRERSGGSSNGSENYRAILWVDATSETATRKAFLPTHELIKDTDSVLQDDDARIRQVKMIIQGWYLPWLIVFDNYDNPTAFPSIRDYIPIPRGKGAVLVTSRHDQAKALGVSLEIPPLLKSEAIDLLRIQIKDSMEKLEAPGSVEAAERIVTRLGFHALAIYQAGCFIYRNDCSVAEFLDLYDKERKKVMSWTASIGAYNLSVSAAFELSFDSLQCDEAPADKIRKFLTICSFLSIKGIPTSLFLASKADKLDALGIFQSQDGHSLDSAKLQAIVRLLRERGLVQPSVPARKNVFSIHPLVSDWLKNSGAHNTKDLLVMQLEDGMQAARIIRDCLEAVAKDLPYSYLDIPSDIRQELLPHVLACETTLLQSGLAQDSLEAYKTCHLFAEFLDSCGDMNDAAQRIQKQAIELLKASSDAADPDGAKLTSSICLLARIYHHQGKPDEATILLKERLQTKVVQGSFEAGNAGAIALAELLTLALCYQRKHQEATAYATDILAVREEHHAQDKRALLRCRAMLAWIWQYSDKVGDAEREENAILEEMRLSFENNDLDILTCLNGLGCIYLGQGKLREAHDALSEAVEGRTARLGREHPSTLNVRTNLSMVLASQGCWLEAIEECRKILQAREAQLGMNHISTLVSVANLLEVGKAAPSGIFKDRAEIGALSARLDKAKKENIWQEAWTRPGVVDQPLPPSSNHSQRGLEEMERPGQRHLASQIASIWHSLGLRRVTRVQAAPAEGASRLDWEERQRIFQSQMQQQQ